MPLPWPLEVQTLARMAAAIAIRLVWPPTQAFVTHSQLPRLDQLLLNAARACLTLVIVGYVLVAMHLYGWVSLVLVVGGLVVPRRAQAREEGWRGTGLVAAAFEELARLSTLPRRAIGHLGPWVRTVLGRMRVTPDGLAAGVLVVLGVSAWMRFAANLEHADPMFSDFVVLEAWVKQIEERRLFPDGIDPKGFRVLLTTRQHLYGTGGG